MATETSFISFLLPSSAFFNDLQQELWYPMSSLFLLVLSLVSLCFLVFVINRRFRRIEVEDDKLSRNAISCSLLDAINQTDESHQTPLVHPLLVEILALDPPKWDSLPSSFHFHLSGKINGEVGNNQAPDGSEVDKDSVNSIGDDPARSDDQRGKKKKRRSKKKRQNYRAEDGCEEGCLESQVSGAQGKHDLVCFYPFTSSSSATQRKIKHQYDQLVKSHDAKALTLAQVGQFVNCLIEARNELQHKSEVIQRKFTIAKALLFKADRSSFDRICQQIYKLEAEQKRLEEDAVVYNWLQQQLKLSPAYKKMLEIGARMELKAKSSQLGESTDDEFADISFEEFLAQEKKDSFWQRNGKLRSCTN